MPLKLALLALLPDFRGITIAISASMKKARSRTSHVAEPPRTIHLPTTVDLPATAQATTIHVLTTTQVDETHSPTAAQVDEIRPPTGTQVDETHPLTAVQVDETHPSTTARVGETHPPTATQVDEIRPLTAVQVDETHPSAAAHVDETHAPTATQVDETHLPTPTQVTKTRRTVHLPTELHCEIIRWLKVDNKKELASLALVSKVWADEVGTMLYRTLTINCPSGVDPFCDLITHLDRYKSTGRLVRMLTLNGFDCHLRCLYPTVATCEDLIAVLSRLPNLTNLVLSTFSVTSNQLGNPSATFTIPFVRLQHLAAFGVGSNPYQLLHLFNGADELELCDVQLNTMGGRYPRPHHLPFHEIFVGRLSLNLSFTSSVDLVPVIPTFRGIKYFRARNVGSWHVGVLGKICSDNSATMETLEITLLRSTPDVLDETNSWYIEGLKECDSLQFTGVVIPFDSILYGSNTDQNLETLGQLFEGLPASLSDLKLVFDFRGCGIDMEVEPYFLALKWSLLQPYLASLTGLRRLCVALSKPFWCKCSDWSTDMVDAIKPAFRFEQYVEVCYFMTP